MSYRGLGLCEALETASFRELNVCNFRSFGSKRSRACLVIM